MSLELACEKVGALKPLKNGVILQRGWVHGIVMSFSLTLCTGESKAAMFIGKRDQFNVKPKFVRKH